jgi:hypothetical protein
MPINPRLGSKGYLIKAIKVQYIILIYIAMSYRDYRYIGVLPGGVGEERGGGACIRTRSSA